MDIKYFLKGIIACFVLNILLLPAYYCMLIFVALGLGVIEHMSAIEKLPVLLIALIPCAIEYVVIYLVAYKSQKFSIIFNKCIIGVQGSIVLFYIWSFLTF